MYVLIIHLYFQWQMNKSTICRHHPPMGIWRLLTIRLCVFMWSHTELLSQSGRSHSTLMGLHLLYKRAAAALYPSTFLWQQQMIWALFRRGICDIALRFTQRGEKYSLPLDGNNSGHDQKHSNCRNDEHISGKCCPIFCETKAMWEQVNMWHNIIYKNDLIKPNILLRIKTLC